MREERMNSIVAGAAAAQETGGVQAFNLRDSDAQAVLNDAQAGLEQSSAIEYLEADRTTTTVSSKGGGVERGDAHLCHGIRGRRS